ncbi:pyridoxal 5'-phosphate synthase glutaminase subunit PdxT [Thermus tengchongensis]|uniref:Pyridoxal 5'-phosphate synthase subunit PdxT n=1 Tax=Thermus tengchongensis TaxID=1214928 RepID=A0A4Y9FBC0_9DEIN|nr:pyridoxal 5'-phosphate synthase glutaminase subunit PdxT [Thermus tengchongensis]TFU16170.1 pyridoxal 5'-phosphate synthase glutaminase subunit PdxT [Thermus tengchongensis]TFU25478.1 pyridoxal 5'-phosphate synthase glutaminase subunit PdxT [Thermus tengchongensis]
MRGVVGVLALQGDFREHKEALRRLGVEAQEVRKREHLEGVKALVVPGGESTTIGKLAREYGIEDEVRRRVEEDSLALFGTCAGAIWLAKEILGYPEQPRLGVLDVAVERNAFGRQVESFEEEVEIKGLGPFRGVFIRAPAFRRLGEGVEVLAELGDLPVLVRQGKVLASAFHPELTPDTRLHRLFLDLAGL